MADFTHKQALAVITARAVQDPAFRRKLLVQPHAAILEATGTTVPSDLRIKFVEKDPDTDVMIVLPDAALEEGELSEADVAGVAGGTNWGCQDVSTE
jgi:hypothetical protein